MTTPPDITLQNRFQVLRNQFTKNGIESSDLDARLLIQAATGLDHAGVILNPNQLLTPQQCQTLDEMAQRRLNNEPVSRILGTKEFYGREFLLSKAVLDPRPDTETLIDLALSITTKFQQLDILDIGTGSGAIAITLLCERPNSQAIATDISLEAIKIAKKNATRHGLNNRLQFIQTSWCENIERRFDLIVSNPPYIAKPEFKQLAPEVKNHDPHLALDGGADGLEAYRQIAKLAYSRLKPDGAIMLEIGHLQGPAVTNIFLKHGFSHHAKLKAISKDLAGNDRVVTLIFDSAKKTVGKTSVKG